MVTDWMTVDQKSKERTQFKDQKIPAEAMILARLVPNKELGQLPHC